MAKNWSIHCAAHIKTSTKGSMVEIVVSAGDSRISRYFALADINTNPVEVYRWLGQCGIVATTDVKKKVVHAVSDLPDPAAGWAAEAPGWYEKAFALPTGVIGVGSHNVLNLIEATSAEKWRCRGTLQAWRRKIAAPLGKSPVAVFALSAALTGPIPVSQWSCSPHFRRGAGFAMARRSWISATRQEAHGRGKQPRQAPGKGGSREKARWLERQAPALRNRR